MAHLVEEIRRTRPVVLTVANMVTPGDVANALNAIGGSPIMSTAPQEAAMMVKISRAITVNIGTLNSDQATEIEAVLSAADATRKPVILDPVAVAVPYREHFVDQLLGQHRVSLLRGNAGEIAHLAGVDWQSKGIDSEQGSASQLVEVARACAQKHRCVVALTGPQDVVTDGNQVLVNDCGTRLFQTYVGCGDMVSTLCGAFLAVGSDHLQAAWNAVRTFTIAGQIAASKLARPVPGSFFTAFLDELSLISDQDVQQLEEESEMQKND
ncbi:hydroxyethylthiazole kinase [Limosilactobacillus difficilis]|uniref:hydroxyethylthiazole kinase n=1 Tax=Limosilactobacillus difficilis TaxID=2991838 RepID=UPI0024BBCE9E|nr:hydroxyethylthiazole kinase [Limosilactobacillus difficilis]